MDADTDEDDMVGTIINNEIEFLWRMVFKYNEGGLDYEKNNLRLNMWGLYINQKHFLIEGGYSVEVLVSHGKKFIWEVVDDNSV